MNLTTSGNITLEFFPVERSNNDFQQTLSATQIKTLCKRAFGRQIQVESAWELASGLFNNTYLIQIAGHQPVILRVSPAPSAVVFSHEANLLQREYTLQTYFATVASFLPRTIMADFSRELLDRDYVFQSFIAGEVWDEIKERLSPEENNDLWGQLGELARQIHCTTGPAFGYPHPERQFSHWSETVIHFTSLIRENLLALELNASGTDAFLVVLATGQHFLDDISEPHLLHGDLWPKNVLIDRQNGSPQIVGLLDSERGFWGDPLAEWVEDLWT